MGIQTWQKQSKMRVPESDSILRVGKFCSPEHPVTTIPVVFIPLNYIDISKELAAEALLMDRFGLGKLCTSLFSQGISFSSTHGLILREFNTRLGKFRYLIWKQSNLHSPNLHRVSNFCGLKHFTEVDSASASQKASD